MSKCGTQAPRLPYNVQAETIHRVVSMSRTIGTFPVNASHREIVKAKDLLELRSDLEHLSRAMQRIQRLKDMLLLELELRSNPPNGELDFG